MTTYSRCSRLLLICGFALLGASCKDSSPTGPSATTPTTTTPSLPPSTGSVKVDINPNPVPFSGQPITDAGPGCNNVKNTWFYDQVLTETGGAEVTFTNRTDTFDGFTVNELSGLKIVVPANGTLTLHTRWCSGTPQDHTARSSFTGTDATGKLVTVTGPNVRLMKP
jgi:hypothetical protein